MAKRTKQPAKQKDSKASADKDRSVGYHLAARGLYHHSATGDFYQCDQYANGSRTDITQVIKESIERFKKGDLSDLDRILGEQLHMVHSATAMFAKLAANGQRMQTKEYGLNGMIQCSRATRQLATAIAQIHKPQTTTFIKAQQNNLYQGDKANAPMDKGSKGSPAATLPESEAMAVQHGATDARGAADKQPEFLEARDEIR